MNLAAPSIPPFVLPRVILRAKCRSPDPVCAIPDLPSDGKSPGFRPPPQPRPMIARDLGRDLTEVTSRQSDSSKG